MFVLFSSFYCHRGRPMGGNVVNSRSSGWNRDIFVRMTTRRSYNQLAAKHCWSWSCYGRQCRHSRSSGWNRDIFVRMTTRRSYNQLAAKHYWSWSCYGRQCRHLGFFDWFSSIKMALFHGFILVNFFKTLQENFRTFCMPSQLTQKVRITNFPQKKMV